MAYDSSRFTFDAWKNYGGVVMQQGRVQLDSDWNEWLAELARRAQAGTLDMVGKTGVPMVTQDAFKITLGKDPSGNATIFIGPGRMYVDGLLAENHGLPAPDPIKWTPTTQINASDLGSAQVTILAAGSVTVAPSSASVAVGNTVQFTGTVPGSSGAALTWSVNGTVGGSSVVGTISASGLYTPPGAVPSPNTVTVTATSQANSSMSSSAQVTILPAVSITLNLPNPPNPSVAVGSTQQFTPAVNGFSNPSLTWSVNNIAGGNSTIGTISTSGLYTAPDAVPWPNTVTITATNNTPSVSGSTPITVLPEVSVAVTPASASVALGGIQPFTATLTGLSNPTMIWSVNGEIGGNSTVGTIDTSGNYTAPSAVPSPSSVTISAAIYPDWNSSLDELVGHHPVDYNDQLYYPNAGILYPFPQSPSSLLVYLDVWQREVTFLEDPDLVEKAVNVDTTGRVQTVWQVKWLPAVQALPRLINQLPKPPAVTCCSDFQGWDQLLLPPPGLTSGVVQSSASSPCCLTSNTGYTGLENQLYRVEIHQPGQPLPSSTIPPVTSIPSGTATFKWSRDNGAVSTGVTEIDFSYPSLPVLTVQSTGKDSVLRFNKNDWVEITDDWLELSGQPGELHQIYLVDDGAKTITLATPISNLVNFPVDSNGLTDPDRHTRLTRWNQCGNVYLNDGSTVWTNLAAAGSTGDIPVPPSGTTLILENGITVAFDWTSQQRSFNSGDYWTLAARTADGTVEFLDNAPPRGIHHHYARLAVIGAGGEIQENPTPQVLSSENKFQDCRSLFPPASELTNLFYIGGDSQEALPNFTQPQNLLPLPNPLVVGVANGEWPVSNRAVQFEVTRGNGQLQGGTNTSTSPWTVVVTTGGDGLASCTWSLDSTTPTQQVTATLLDECGNKVASLAIEFTATLITDLMSLFYVSGDAQAAVPNPLQPKALLALADPLIVGVANGEWPVNNRTVRFQITSGTGLLQSETWKANTLYAAGTNILDANGNVELVTVTGTSGAFPPTWPSAAGGKVTDGGVTWQLLALGTTFSWQPNTAYPVGARVIDSNGNLQVVPLAADAGTSGAAPPAWPATLGTTVRDGSVTWQLLAVGASTCEVVTDINGLARCFWAVDSTDSPQEVTATLLDRGGNPLHLPVIFTASLSTASAVAFSPSQCTSLAGAITVQQAIDLLCPPALYYVSGDGQDALPGQQLPQPLRVRVATGLIPGVNVLVTFYATSGVGVLSGISNNQTVTGTTINIPTGANGIAECFWTLDKATNAQSVMATINNNPNSVVYFNANFDPGVHITGIQVYDWASQQFTPLTNGMLIPAAYFCNQPEIKIECDQALNANTVNPGTCFVSLDWPSLLSREYLPITRLALAGEGGEVGWYQPAIAQASLSTSPNAIFWQPVEAAQSLISELAGNLGSLSFPPCLLARLTLKGNSILSTNNLYLDGDAFFAANGALVNGMSGDGRRGGNFEMYFGLTWNVLLTLPSGTEVSPSAAVWEDGTFYAQGATIIDSNGNLETAITAGTSGRAQPQWPTSGSTTVADGTSGLTWQFGSPPSQLVFGNYCSAEATQIILVTNNSNASLEVNTSIPKGSISGTGGEFSATPALNLAPRGSGALYVAFTPTSTLPGTPASCSATVVITTSDANEPSTSVALTASVMVSQPTVSLSASVVDFGTLVVGITKTLSITITNTSTSNKLFITDIYLAIVGPNAGDFAVQSNTCANLSQGLPQKESCALGVAFSPSQSGPRAALLTITDSSGGSPQTVFLTGVGETLYYGYGYGAYEGIGAELI